MKRGVVRGLREVGGRQMCVILLLQSKKLASALLWAEFPSTSTKQDEQDKQTASITAEDKHTKQMEDNKHNEVSPPSASPRNSNNIQHDLICSL